MHHTIIALYHSLEDARAATDELARGGYRREQISLIAQDAGSKYASFQAQAHPEAQQASDMADATMTGAGTGVMLGTALGLLVAGAALTVPGLGPIIAAGPVATLLATTGAGALAGAAVGSAVGALTAMGVPDEDAALYAEGLRRGGALLTLQAPAAQVAPLTALLKRHDPIDIDEAGARWRAQGWDPTRDASTHGALAVSSNTPTLELPAYQVRALARGSVQVKDPDQALEHEQAS